MANQSDRRLLLRCDELNLEVSFPLNPGDCVRVGSGAEAEMRLPIVGLREEECRLSADEFGGICVTREGKGPARRIAVPGTLRIGPYLFKIEGENNATVPAARTGKETFALAAVGFLTIGLVVAIIAFFAFPAKHAALNTAPGDKAKSTEPESRKPEAAIANVGKERNTDTAPATLPTVADANTTAVTVRKASDEGQSIQISQSPAPASWNLETIAAKLERSVFMIEAKAKDGGVIGTGTGFAIATEGLVATNYHVVEKAVAFSVLTPQGARFEVKSIIAVDQGADLAILELNARSLDALELGSSEAVAIGSRVAAYGSPSGFSGSLSEGIISARRRIDEAGFPNGGDLLQTTTPVSPGSSGSPLVDKDARVIGVVTLASSGKLQNLNFAVPVEALKRLKGQAEVNRDREETSAPPPTSDSKRSRQDELFVADADYERVRNLLKSSLKTEAFKVCKELRARHPDSSEAHYSYAMLAELMGLYDEAVSAFRKAVSINPKDAESWNRLGAIYLRKNLYVDALSAFEKAAAANPEMVEVWCNMALLHMDRKRWTEAYHVLSTLSSLNRAAFVEYVTRLRRQIQAGDVRDFLDTALSSIKPPNLVGQKPAGGNTTEAENIISGFLARGAGPDSELEIADYSDVVAPYFDEGRKTREQIRADVLAYRKRWPSRSFELTSLESAHVTGTLLTATYTMAYEVANGTKVKRGSHRQHAMFRRGADGRWRVIGIKTLR